LQSLKSRGIQAFIWDLLGRIGTHASTFIVTIFLARLLEPADFGLLAMIMVVVTIATIFSDLGLGGALIQRRRLHLVHYNSVFFFNILIAAILTLITYLSAGYIATFYNNEQLGILLEVMSFIFIISALHTVQNIILQKELNHKRRTKINVIASIISGFFGVAFAFWGFGVWSLVIQLFLREILTNILIWHSTNWIPSISFSWKALKQLWVYGFNMFLAGLLNVVYERLDYMFIGKLFTPAILGFFHQAKQLDLFIVKYSSGSLMSVLFPVLSKIQHDDVQFKRIVIKSLGLISFLTFLLLGELYLVADELIIILFGEKWALSSYYFKILALSGFAYPISVLMLNILSSRGKSKEFLRLEIYKKIIQSFNFYVLFEFGMDYFLYGLVLVSFLGVGLNILFAKKEIELSFFTLLRPILVQMILTIITVLLVIYISDFFTLGLFLMMLLKSVLFVGLYFLLNWVLKIKSYIYVEEQVLHPLLKKLKER